MGLSANAARTLEQVKSGLSILYGADYFTEEEWIKLDGLIHKGKYVFTRGPQANILDEELMSFDDFEDTTALPPADDKTMVHVAERQVPTPISEKPSANFSDSILNEFSESLPNETSAESSADASAHASTDEAYANESSAVEKTPTPPLPTNGGLAFYTQAQLDEVKAFNSNLTRAGQKNQKGARGQKEQPNYTSSADHSFQMQEPNYSSTAPNFTSSAWTQEGELIEQTPSPTSAEQESRIHSWASEVNAEGITPVFSQVVEPTNSKYASNGSNPTEQNIPQVVEKFIQIHGRNPGSANDVYQPRNLEFKGPRRPDSRASVRTTKSALPKVQRKLHATSGTIFVAHANFPKKTSLSIEVMAGDSIKYIKAVSGIMHIGQNLRTKQMGQFPETILEPDNSQSLIQQQRSAIQSVYGRERGTTIMSATSNGLDRVEAMNAAEWDRESEVSRQTTATTGSVAVAPAPMRSNTGLAGSRFAALVEMQSQDGESERGIGGLTQAEVRKIIREELATKTPTQPQGSRPVAPGNALTNIVPKVTTCWFWKTKNDCRFTAEECIHLHQDLPDGGEPSNLRFGKPTWGALADAKSPQSTIIAAPSEVNPAIEFKLFSKSKTCYYWATEGKCNNSAVDCKYLHEYTAAGVAPKPNSYVAHKKDFNWSKVGRNGAGTELPSSPGAQTLHTNEYGWGTPDGKGEVADVPPENTWGSPNSTTAALMANPNAAIWGAVEGGSAWDTDGDTYKPPHIKALEERQRIEAVGW